MTVFARSDTSVLGRWWWTVGAAELRVTGGEQAGLNVQAATAASPADVASACDGLGLEAVAARRSVTRTTHQQVVEGALEAVRLRREHEAAAERVPLSGAVSPPPARAAGTAPGPTTGSPKPFE